MKPMGLIESLLFFGIPTLLLYLATHVCIPLLSSATGLPVVVAWFICAGLLVFLPLFGAAFVFYRIEGQPWKISALLARFRLNHLSWRDLAGSVLGVLGVGVFIYGIIEMGQRLVPGFSAQPSFDFFSGADWAEAR